MCRHPLGGGDIASKLYRIENVGTRQVERITANDEERRRQGYELQTTFSFHGAVGIRSTIVEDAEGSLLAADFAPAALVRRINKGLRRRKDLNEVGFWIDPKSGYWIGAARPGEADDPSPTRFRQQLTPVVEDRKNALLLRFPAAWLAAMGDTAVSVVATIQHALARGVEGVYQLEEGEILVEPTPARKDRRGLLFYEAAEGGAGALSRLVSEEGAFQAVARKALEVMHYDLASLHAAAISGPSALLNLSDARCVAGCYRCLLSYFNQPDHELIDRRQDPALAFLIRLAFAATRGVDGAGEPHPDLGGCPPPDAAPLVIDGHSIELIWRSARIAAAEEGSVPPGLNDDLAARGIELILLPSAGTARSQVLADLAVLLGGKPL